uniref:Putative myosin light chain kinase n=1 Tax=Ornithodoros turicata TaxID=34597 RepID=A0A2R5LCZ3_9ACAR
MPEWKRELIHKKRTMQKAFPSWAALSEAASSEQTTKKAVHLVAERVPVANGLVCPSPTSSSTRHSMGEDRFHDGSESSAYSDHSSAHGDLSSEGEPDCEEWEYGPGFVDRLKSKFISLSLREAGRASAPLRSYASVENLLDAPRRSGGRRAAPAARFKKAQSMEALEPLANDRLVIVEKSPPRRQASNSISDDELPKPDIVRTYKRIFEASVDNRRPNTVRRRPSVGRTTQPGSPKRARALASSRVPGRVPANKENQPRTPPVRKPIANIKPLPKEPPPSPPPPTSVISDPPEKEVAPLKPSTPPPATLKPSIPLPSSSEEPVLRPSALLRTATPTSSLWSATPGGTGGSAVSPTSVVFDFRGKNVKPHVAVLPAPIGCCKNGDLADELDSSEEQLPYPSGIVFVGENVRVGRGALLTTRNKKLKIQFNDSAVVRIEYPADDETPETPPVNGPEFPPKVESPRVPVQSPGLPSASGSLGSYTPSALCSSDGFQLGLSRAAVPPTSAVQMNGTGGQDSSSEDLEEELTPADPSITSGWSSSTDTADLLF